MGNCGCQDQAYTMGIFYQWPAFSKILAQSVSKNLEILENRMWSFPPGLSIPLCPLWSTHSCIIFKARFILQKKDVASFFAWVYSFFWKRFLSIRFSQSAFLQIFLLFAGSTVHLLVLFQSVFLFFWSIFLVWFRLIPGVWHSRCKKNILKYDRDMNWNWIYNIFGPGPLPVRLLREDNTMWIFFSFWLKFFKYRVYHYLRRSEM